MYILDVILLFQSDIPVTELVVIGSGLYSGGLNWSIVLRCDDHTGIFYVRWLRPGPVLLCARRDTELCD